MADEFSLTPPPDRPRMQNGGRRSGAGRPAGSKNRLVRKLNEGCFRAAAREVPEVLAGVLKRAKRLNEPHWTPNATDAGLATWVLEHFWAVPRSAPIQIDLRDPASMQDALEAGEVTPGDYGALVRASSANPHAIAGPPVDLDETRKRLTARLEAAVRERQSSAAAAGIGFDIPTSEDRSAAESAQPPPPAAAEPAPPPAIADMGAAIQAALDAGDAAALEAIADELERGE